MCPDKSASREGVPVEVMGWPVRGEGRIPGGGAEEGGDGGVGGELVVVTVVVLGEGFGAAALRAGLRVMFFLRKDMGGGVVGCAM